MTQSDLDVLRQSPLVVWAEAWQRQCCGVGFAVEETVRWTVHSYESRKGSYLFTVLGADVAATVSHSEDSHYDFEDEELVEGIVRSIRVVTYGLQAVPDQYRAYEPVPGTTRLDRVDVADLWAPEPPHKYDGGPRAWYFAGWLVELDALVRPRRV